MKHFLLAVVLCLTVSACGQNSTNGSLSAQNTTCSSVRSNDSACVVLALNNNAGAASVTVPTNAGGNTLQFEASGDNGSTWVAINGTPPNSSVGASSTTSTGTWRFAVSGLTNLRVRCSTFVSGTSYVVIQSSPTAASLGGGVGISANGAANDIAFFSAPGVIGPADTGVATYSSSTLAVPNLTLSGTATVAGQVTGTGGLLSTGNNYLGAGTPNEGTTGTTNGSGAKFVNTAGVVQAKLCATTDTAIPCWPTFAQRNTSTNAINGCTSGCLTGNAYLATTPGMTIAVTFDNTSVVGHYVIASTSVAGQYHDTGSATAPTSNWYLGRAQTAGTGSQTVSIEPQVGAGGGAAPTVNAWYNGPAINGTAAMVANAINGTRLWGIVIPTGVSASSGVCVYIQTADNSANLYDVGVYDTSANLVAHIGATAGTTFAAATGQRCFTWTGGTVTINAGKYYFAITGNAATAVLGGASGAGIGPNFASAISPTGGTTVGGVLNASGVITIPADSWPATGGAGTHPNVTIHN